MIQYYVCDKCPCLNSDYEAGAWCNLDYNTSLEWVDKKTLDVVEDTPEMRSHQKDVDLKNISYDYKLCSIICLNKFVYPVTVEIREETL